MKISFIDVVLKIPGYFKVYKFLRENPDNLSLKKFKNSIEFDIYAPKKNMLTMHSVIKKYANYVNNLSDNKSEAARILGVDRKTLRKYLSETNDTC